jgi:hypothetical protein
MREAVILVMDFYDLFSLAGGQDISFISAGKGRDCCGAGGGSDAETLGGPNDPDPQTQGSTLRLCFCAASMRTKLKESYAHFVRIVGHEMVHIPQHKGKEVSHPDVFEFEAYYWQACGTGLAPEESTASIQVAGPTGQPVTTNRRKESAESGLEHWDKIPYPARTPDRYRRKLALDALVANNGKGACTLPPP